MFYSDTAELMRLGNTYVKDSSNDFTFLEPRVSYTSDRGAGDVLSDHTLLESETRSLRESIQPTEFSGIPSEADSFKSLPRNLLGVSSSLSRMRVDLDDVPKKLMYENDSNILLSSLSSREGKFPARLNFNEDSNSRPTTDDDSKTARTSSSSSSASTLVVSDSGASLDSGRRRTALDVQLDAGKLSFSLKVV